MAGVGAVFGVVLGAVGELPELPEPPMFGQLTPEWVRGVPVPPVPGVVVPPFDGAVVLGADEGDGLAAETAATPPPTRRRPEIAAAIPRGEDRWSVPPPVRVRPPETGSVRAACSGRPLRGS